jgi:hypothetical protein
MKTMTQIFHHTTRANKHSYTVSPNRANFMDRDMVEDMIEGRDSLQIDVNENSKKQAPCDIEFS